MSGAVLSAGSTDFPREHCVCFTGHRPQGIPPHYTRDMLRSMLCTEISDAIQAGYYAFYTGAAPGIDLLGAEIILELRQQNPALRLICASPYPRFGAGDFHGADKPLLMRVYAAADGIVYTSEHFHRGCFQIRNRYMVDHSARIIGVLCNEASGTGQTLRMAQSQGLELRVLRLSRHSGQTST